ncbi:MAG: DUF6391 domain-containing protein [Anaerolineae bacterium]
MAASDHGLLRNPLTKAAAAVGHTRRNHALEHATVHVLTRKYPHLRAVGRTTPSGFYLYGDLDTGEVEQAARQALAELPTHPDLAVHARCGTNLAVTALAAGLAAFAASTIPRRPRASLLPQALLASLSATLLAQPLGAAVQREVTTSPDVAGARIGAVQRSTVGNMTTHFVPVLWE